MCPKPPFDFRWPAQGSRDLGLTHSLHTGVGTAVPSTPSWMTDTAFTTVVNARGQCRGGENRVTREPLGASPWTAG